MTSYDWIVESATDHRTFYKSSTLSLKFSHHLLVFIPDLTNTLFIPFMAGAEKERFWFPLAAETIDGLVMSVVGVFILLPILTNKKGDTGL